MLGSQVTTVLPLSVSSGGWDAESSMFRTSFHLLPKEIPLVAAFESSISISRESYLGLDMGSVLHDLQQGTNRRHILSPIQAVPQEVKTPRHTISECQQLILRENTC